MASGLHEHNSGPELPEGPRQPDAKRAHTVQQDEGQALLQASMLRAMEAHQLADMAAEAAATAGAAGLPPIPAGSLTEATGGGTSSGSQPAKRGRGRPQGSKNKINKTGSSLIPHVMLINHGEDVAAKLGELSRAYRRSLVVLAASGTLSVATLMQMGADGRGVGVTLHGHFTILSMSGAMLQVPCEESADLPRRQQREPSTAFLSASLANPSGGVVGGTVAGELLAAGLVTLVLGHWDPDKGAALQVDGEGGLTDSQQSPVFGNMAAAALLGSSGLGGAMAPLLPLGAGVWPFLSLERDTGSAEAEGPPGALLQG